MTSQATTRSDQPVRLLVVCTANRCRSPLAGAMLEEALARRGVPATVETAGFGGGGQPATRETQAVATARGLDLTGHRSAHLGPRLADADVVLAMERLHVRDVVVADAGAWPRTFTLKEAVRRGEAVGPRQPGEPLEGWLARVHEGRQTQELLGVSPDDDVADPTGGTRVEHEEMSDELADLISRFVDLAWPPTVAAVDWMPPAS